MSMKRKVWPDETYPKIITLFGLMVVLTVAFTGLGGILFEAPGFAQSVGSGTFAKDTVVRLAATTVFAALAWLPYYLALKMYRNWPRTVFFFTVFIFLVDVSQRFYAYVLSGSSTAGLIDLFLPLWLSTALFVLWAILAVFQPGNRESKKSGTTGRGNI